MTGKNWLTIFFLVLLACLLFGCRGPEEGAEAPDGGARRLQKAEAVDSPVARGQAVYEETGCATCHPPAEAGPGIGPVLKDLSKKFTDEQLKKILRDPRLLNPNTTMPAFEGTEEELVDLIAYLKTLK
ncbi:MAG: cytochrome c [Armatimonadetes bacterium]|nr:cytochrome c [Armatimonadota bacterium]MDW8122846.1 c-type cytochrome [Armatimonadota bacterium]